jgi:hypothetical protein
MLLVFTGRGDLLRSWVYAAMLANLVMRWYHTDAVVSDVLRHATLIVCGVEHQQRILRIL